MKNRLEKRVSELEQRIEGLEARREDGRATQPRFQIWPDCEVLVGEIIRAVAEHHGMKPRQLLSRCREAHFIWPRHLAIWLAVKLVNEAPSRVLAPYFKRDRSMIDVAAKHAQDRIDTESAARAEAEFWMQMFRSSEGNGSGTT